MRVTKSSKEIAAEIAALEKERDDLHVQLKATEESLKNIKSRLSHLTGMSFGSYDRGYIACLRRDLETAKLQEADALAMKVRTKTSYNKEYDDGYVLRKVTKKLIFLASPGSHHCDRYDHQGKSPYRTIHPEDLAKIMESQRA